MIKPVKKALCLTLASLVLLCGCSRGEEKRSRTLFAMDTAMTVSVWGDSADAALDSAAEMITRFDLLFDKDNEESPLWQLNHAQGSKVALPEEITAQLDCARGVYYLSGGALNPALEPVIAAWGFDGSDFRVPTGEELAALLETTDFPKLSQSGSNVSMPDGMSITLGATAKGYTAGKIRELLRGMGVTSALIDLGGNVCTLGNRPDGERWKIGVASPDGNGCCATLFLSDEAAVTSGDYQRYFEQDGKRYHHIIDPETGMPADSGLSSVTVVCADSLYADCLSTALFVLGEEKARSLRDQYGGFEAVFVASDGKVSYTDGLKGKIELTPQ